MYPTRKQTNKLTKQALYFLVSRAARWDDVTRFCPWDVNSSPLHIKGSAFLMQEAFPPSFVICLLYCSTLCIWLVCFLIKLGWETKYGAAFWNHETTRKIKATCSTLQSRKRSPGKVTQVRCQSPLGHRLYLVGLLTFQRTSYFLLCGENIPLIG